MFFLHKLINSLNIFLFNFYILSVLYGDKKLVLITFPLVYLYVNIYLFYQLYIYDYVDYALFTFKQIENINSEVSHSFAKKFDDIIYEDESQETSDDNINIENDIEIDYTKPIENTESESDYS